MHTYPYKKLCLKVFYILILLSSSVLAEQSIDKLMIGQFSSGTLDQWKSKAFKGRTHYQLTDLAGTTVLKAESNGSASGQWAFPSSTAATW